MSKIRVLVVDDHTIVREGVCTLLSAYEDIEVVGEAVNGLEAVAKVGELHPDIALMDVSMPELNGLEATRLIKKDFPQTQIVALTVHGGAEYFFRILSAGASGYLMKGVSSAELVSALRAVHQGGVYLDPSLAGQLVQSHLQRVKGGGEWTGYDSLTPREREVLKLLGEGRTNQEIADILVLSPNTVQTHRSRIMDKLGLQSRTQLIKYALSKGLTDISG